MEPSDFETEFIHEKVLSLSRSEFLDDFEINDVYRELENRNILTLNDLKEMQKCSGKEEKIDMLFFLLVIRGKRTFDNFFHILKAQYSWLSVAIEQRLRQERAAHSHEYGDASLESILKLRKELPKFVDFNIHRCELLWKIRQKVLALNRLNQYMVVHGSLSQGKRWIVMDALCSYQCMNRMGGNVFWINCSKCKTNESILMQLERLFIKSQPVHERVITPSNYNDINNKILNYTESLRQIFEKGALRDCLLVLIDVQSYETIRAFDLNCKTLITTRDKKLLDKFPDATPKIEVDCGFSDDECKDFFSKVLKIQKDRLPDEVLDIHRMCKNNPFVISVIAMNVKQHDLHLSRWQYWKDLLKKNQFGTVEKLRKPIEESLKDLRRTNEALIKRLESLTIFTDNVNIPMKVLQLYWNLPAAEVDHIVDTLDGLYLLQTMSDDKGTMYCSLHHLYYSYLANTIVTSDEKQKMHKTLVDGYRIMEALRTRSEPFIKDLPNDEYFHYYIGYHLKECGSYARHLFPLLYYDFGFLEQKLRYTGLSNILGDFKLYGNEIISNGPPRIPIDELTDFLAYIEELLLASKDGCLLQYALTEENSVGEEARKQAQMFKNRIWFYDTDHSVKYRQIIKLPENVQPKCINFFEPNTSLIAFTDNSIHLIDMSYEYQLRSSIYAGHSHAICDIQLFGQNHFVSLDAEGTIKIWSLKDTEIGRRRLSRQEEEIKVGARQSINSPKCKKSEQNHLQSIENGRNRFTSILVLNASQLLAAATDGEVLSFNWDADSNKFELRRSSSIRTKNSRILKMIVIQNTLMTVNNVGETNFHSLIDHAMLRTTFSFPNESPIDVYHLPHVAENPKTVSDQHTIAVIFPSGIYQLKLSQFHSNMNGNQGAQAGAGRQVVERLSEYRFRAEQNTITCCTITNDGHYLMLGTKKGIIVLDPKSNREILRSSISDKLTSIDVCTVEHSACKYMLISATKKGQSVIYVHGIHFKDNLMQWSTNKIETPMSSRDTMIAWFRGDNVFDVCEVTDTNGNEKFELVAADLKDLVHTRFSSDNFIQTSRYESFESCITAISIGKERKFIACTNGTVHEISNDKKIIIMELPDEVEYLRYIEEMDVLIAGSRSIFRVHSKRKDSGVQSSLIQNTFVHDKSIIVVLKIDGTFQILDMLSYKLIDSHARTNQVICSCFNDGKIAVGSDDGHVSIFDILRNETGTPSIEFKTAFKSETNSKMKSISLIEAEKLLIAIGFENGIIDLYDIVLNEVNILEKLESHTKCVESLYFSRWHKDPSIAPGTPIILVSLSSEICFWNITHILNNPMKRSSNRKSARFDRDKPFGKRNENHRNSNTNGNVNHLTINKELYDLSLHSQNHSETLANNKISNGNASPANPWIDKFGSLEKPELLSCIKFVGNSTKKTFINKSFTKFITIDNEGEVYYLRAMDCINPSAHS